MTRHHIADHAAQVVADWPRLDRAQIDRLAALLTDRPHKVRDAA